MRQDILRGKLSVIVSSKASESQEVDKILDLFHKIECSIDICLRQECNDFAQTNYRLCAKHLAEAHARGFDDSDK